MPVTEEQFRKDVSAHRMQVIRDDGPDRHIRFREPGTFIYGFDLITWPGHLCITGDCGTYVFARVEDMFCFFRSGNRTGADELRINPGYWGEKLLAAGTPEGFKEYSPDCFRERIEDLFSDWEFDSEEQKQEVWEDIREEVLAYADDGEVRARDAAEAYKSEYGHKFSDFWETDLMLYTHHFIWCLYAIVWGIELYDQSKEKQAA